MLALSFIIYILCLFQVVTFQDDTSWASNDFIPFKEILRYNITSRLFLKNVIARTRPFDINTDFPLLISKPHDFSFPSGHTLASIDASISIFLYNKKYD